MNSPKRPRAVQTPLAGVTSVPAPKRDGGDEKGRSSLTTNVDRDQRADPALVTEPKRLPGVRSLAGVPMKDPSRKGPPPRVHLPHATKAGRIGKSRSPWRHWEGK